MKILSLILLYVSSTQALSAEKLIATGEVFDKEGKNKKFNYERYQDVQGDKTLDRAVYKDLEGEVLVEEKMESQNGNLIRYDIDQKQLKQKAWIEVSDKQVTFNLKKFRKRNYPQSIKKKDNFIVGLQIVPFVRKNWDGFLKKEEKEIKLGVWHRQEAITFDLTTDKLDKDQLVVKMNPSSMFIRAVVNPIYFVFNAKDKTLIEYRGRTTPKEKRGKNYHDFDGITRYKTIKK